MSSCSAASLWVREAVTAKSPRKNSLAVWRSIRGHQKAGTHDGVDAKRLGRIDLASDSVCHDFGVGVIGDAGIVVLRQLMQRVDQDHGLVIAREQHTAKTLEHIGIKAGQIVNRPRVVYEQLRTGVLSLERIEHARHTLVIDMCHETSFR